MKARPSRPVWRVVNEAAAPVALAAATLLAVEPSASAQLRGDATLEAGAVTRFASGGTGGDAARVGPLVGLHGHLALLPLVRLGAYASAELAPDGEPSARRIYAGGLRVKVSPPWPRDEVRAWLFAGLGYAGAYAPSTTVAASPAGDAAPHGALFAPGASGGFVEIPLGVGAEWRLRKPWAISAELSGRVGLGFSGSLYEASGRPAFEQGSSVPASLVTRGHDVFALGLTVGIGFDR